MTPPSLSRWTFKPSILPLPSVFFIVRIVSISDLVTPETTRVFNLMAIR